MKYNLNKQQDDQQIINEYIQDLIHESSKSLVDKYNKEAKCGITAVRRQALYLYALRQVFIKRFGDSPVKFEGDMLSLSGEVDLIGEKTLVPKNDKYIGLKNTCLN